MFNPSRLSLARQRRRLTAKALAEAAGISPITVTRLETGGNEPERATVHALAAALAYPPEFFFGDEPARPDQQAASFRSLTAMSARERDAALSAGALAYMLSDWIGSRFNLPAADLIDASQERDPASAARALRQHWRLGEQPVADMVRLMEAKGIRVFSMAEDTCNVDAFSCWRDDVPYVFLNTWKTAERSRFDAAHELGHLVLHKHGGPHQGKAAEFEAQMFAASFLMPEPDVRTKIPRAVSLDALIVAKRRWGVSVSALAYRLHKLGILTDWLYRGMVIEMGRRGYRSNEPNGMPRESSVLLKHVLTDLWHDGISRSHIAKDLKIPADELENLVFGLLGANEPSTTETAPFGKNDPKPGLRLV